MSTMVLNFVPADQAPLEWRDGRELLAATKRGDMRVVWWHEDHGWVYYVEGYWWRAHVEECRPTYLAEIPDMTDA